MSTLKLFLLGSPRLERDGEPLKVDTRKSMALLAYLATTGETFSRESLVTLFWPELEPSRARAGLRRNLSMLKKTLAGEWLVADRETISLDHDTDAWVDVKQFHQLLEIRQTHSHPATDICADCLSTLAETVELYRGDFLAGFTLRDSPTFDEWQFFQAENLRQELAAALEYLVRGHSSRQAYQIAIPYARRWLSLDPLHEPVHRHLMKLYACTGQRAAALRQYTECERILKEELDLSPDEETVQLYAAIKEKRALPPASSQMTPPSRGASGQQQDAKTQAQRERYHCEKKVGQGAMGEVWLATDTILDRPVAIKFPKVLSAIGAEQLLQEARLLAGLNHPNITTIHDFFIDPGEERFYLVMEYVDGKVLSDFIKDDQPLPLDLILEIVRGILRALSYAHRQDVVHRDVKPGNVMIASDVKLLDFGLSNLASLLEQGAGFTVGTPAYMAPEQVDGRPMDGRADLYALGVVLFEMITGGQLPFAYTDEDEMMQAHLHASPPPLSQFVSTVPPSLEHIVMRLLAKDPKERYPSADAVLNELDTIHVGPKLNNLPLTLTPFVGREATLAEINDRLQDPACRLLTLIGPGGIGKTRLALRAARLQLDHFAHGIFFVSLASLQTVEAIVPTVAKALSFSFYEGGEPQQQLLDYLREKNMLLILDNFEHLLDGVDLVTDILTTAPNMKILVTSRAKLNVQGEYLFPVVGMDFPDEIDTEDAVRYSAVKLFLASARRSQPDFEPTTANLSDIVRICRLVQGMPLGIELAAGWTEALSPAEVVTEISRSFDFLETELRDVPIRQRSMRAIFDHSWRLLTQREQEVFQALSVFRGGFTREAANEVVGASLRDLMGLVNKSLMPRNSAGRYEMHELLQQYAAEKLEASDQTDTVRDAHSAYFAEFLHQRLADLKGQRQLGAMDEIDADFENIRVAWTRALEQKNYSAIKHHLRSLGWYCRYRNREQELEELHQQARKHLAPGPRDDPHPVWARVLVGEFYVNPDKVDRKQIETSLDVAQKYGDREMIGYSLRTLGEIAFNTDDYAEALAFFKTSLIHFRVLDDSFNIAGTLSRLAEAYRLLGQPQEAIQFARQSLDLSRKIGDKYWAGHSLSNAGVTALYTGNYTEAEDYLKEANIICRELGYREGVANSNVDLGKLAFLRRDFAEVKTLTEEALEIAIDLGNKPIAKSARNLRFSTASALGEKTDERPDEEKLAHITDMPPTIDRFEVKEVLGTGGMGSVYLAHDLDNGCDVALKVINLELFTKELKEAFGFKLNFAKSKILTREAEVMVKLAQHPAFPACYGYGETADTVYIALEYIDGKDLETILEEQENFLPEKMVIEWAIQICDALAHVHNQKPSALIFRDLKPNNVMIDHTGKVRLIDLGIAEPYQPGRELPLVGTEGYSPPEQYIGYSDARSDIYGLGATLHHLLTSRDPRKEIPFSFHEAPPRSLNPTISETLEAVILKAVAYKAEGRYQSATEMKTALVACLR